MQSTIRSDATTDHAMNESRTKRTIIFSPKICDNVDLLVGNIIRIFPPWYASNSYMCSLCLLVARIYIVFLSATLSFSVSDKTKLFMNQSGKDENYCVWTKYKYQAPPGSKTTYSHLGMQNFAKALNINCVVCLPCEYVGNWFVLHHNLPSSLFFFCMAWIHVTSKFRVER